MFAYSIYNNGFKGKIESFCSNPWDQNLRGVLEGYSIGSLMEKLIGPYKIHKACASHNGT